MFLADHLLNQGVTDYLRKQERSAIPIASPDSAPEPYLRQGCHPDIVQRVWDQLGSVLPQDSRCLVYGIPALVHPVTGIVLAVCMGTQYCLRLNRGAMGGALKLGAVTVMKWSANHVTNLTETFGSDWIFGKWFKEEPEWCRVAYASLNNIQSNLINENLS